MTVKKRLNPKEGFRRAAMLKFLFGTSTRDILVERCKELANGDYDTLFSTYENIEDIPNYETIKNYFFSNDTDARKFEDKYKGSIIKENIKHYLKEKLKGLTELKDIDSNKNKIINNLDPLLDEYIDKLLNEAIDMEADYRYRLYLQYLFKNINY